MSSDENIQYMLLALVNGLEAYNKRTQHIADVEHRDKQAKPQRDLNMQATRSRIDSTNALTEQRKSKTSDPFDEALKDIPGAQQMQARVDVTDYFKKGKNFDEVLQMAHDKYGGVDKEFPMPEPTEDFEGKPVPPEGSVTRAIEKNRRDAKNRHVQSLGALLKLQGGGYDPWAGKAAAAGAGAVATGAGPQAMQAPPPAGMNPTPGAAGHPSRGQLMGGGAVGRMTGQVGPQTGGAKITPPRMPTQQVAEQNFQAFANAPQGPGTNMGDQRRAGEVAQLWTVVMDQNMPFEKHASAWFKLHDILGVPVPDVFQQFATGMGIPRSAIDAASGQQSAGSGWTNPSMGQPPPRR